MHRIRIILTDGRYVRLLDQRRRSLRASVGAWQDRDFDGEQYVEQIRSQGLGERLNQYGR